MEKIVTIDQENKINTYHFFDGFLLVNKKYSCFHFNHLSLNKCYQLTSQIHNMGKKAYLLIDRVLFDDDLRNLKRTIVRFEKVNIDGFFFSDLGLIPLLKELGILNKGIYYSQTQIVSEMELETFNHFGLKGIFASKEFPKENISKVIGKYPLGINVYGYKNLFYSRRKLLSAYKEEFNEKGKYIHNQNFKIKEKKRDIKNLIFEDQYGTYIFTDYIDNQLNNLLTYQEKRLKYALFDDNLVDFDKFISDMSLLKNMGDK